MTDLALAWNADAFRADLVMGGADLATDAGLYGAILISLFSDRRASSDDELPADGADPRGWWGDVAPTVEADQIGSRLWVLGRDKRTAGLLVRVREIALEALAWLTEDGVASSVEVEASKFGDGGVAIAVSITRPQGPARQRFDYVWGAL